MIEKSDVSIIKLKGLPAAPGIACGQPLFLDDIMTAASRNMASYQAENNSDSLLLEKSELNSQNEEIMKLQQTIKRVSEQMIYLLDKAEQEGRTEQADILNFHKVVLDDKNLQKEAETLIRDYGKSAETAVRTVFMKQIERFESSKNDRVRAWSLDLYDMLNRIILILNKSNEVFYTDIPAYTVIIASDISPMQLINLPSERLAGIISEQGSPESHAAIIAAGMQIPAVFSCVGILEAVKETSTAKLVMLDGGSGEVLINPDNNKFCSSDQLNILADKPAITADGTRIELLANIVNVQEYRRLENIQYDGTGLLRTETLFAGRNIFPDEEIQFISYRQAVMLAGNCDRPIIIRTFDLISEQSFNLPNLSIVPDRDCDPADRGLARSLHDKDEFKTQLRAIFRAFSDRRCSLLFPLVLSVNDFAAAAAIAREVNEELQTSKLPAPSELEIGAMIETPEAVESASALLETADFISIGSNDLASYSKDGLFAKKNLEMIRLLTSQPAAKSGKKRVIICGELAASPESLPIWLGLGLRSFSIAVHRIPEFKKTVSTIMISEAEKMADKLIK